MEGMRISFRQFFIEIFHFSIPDVFFTLSSTTKFEIKHADQSGLLGENPPKSLHAF